MLQYFCVLYDKPLIQKFEITGILRGKSKLLCLWINHIGVLGVPHVSEQVKVNDEHIRKKEHIRITHNTTYSAGSALSYGIFELGTHTV